MSLPGRNVPERVGVASIEVIAKRLYRDARSYRAALPRDEAGNPAAIQDPTDDQLSLSCLLNSIALAHSAELLAGEGEHGPATSFLVLGIEELSKSVVFRWFGWGLFMRYRISRLPSDSRTILYPHTRRNWA